MCPNVTTRCLWFATCATDIEVGCTDYEENLKAQVLIFDLQKGLGRIWPSSPCHARVTGNDWMIAYNELTNQSCLANSYQLSSAMRTMG